MGKVFVSYSSKDRGRIAPLVNAIETVGFTVWWDRELISGDVFAVTIQDALEGADAVIVCWTVHSIDSNWVRDEAQRALQKGTLIPVLLDDVAPPLGFGAIQAEDFSQWQAHQPAHNGALDRLVKTILKTADARARIKGLVGERRMVDIGPVGSSRSKILAFGDGIAFSDLEHSPQIVTIPAGHFLMGSPETEAHSRDSERPMRRVHVERPFGIGRAPVNVREWAAYVNADPTTHRPPERGWGGASRPVVDVSFQDAEAYCRYLSKETGRRYRLPSEAEWEYSARSGTSTPFWWGELIEPARANYLATATYCGSPKGNYRARATPIDGCEPNLWGLVAVHGNVWEWVADWWHPNYEHAPTTARPWEAERGGDPGTRVLRGGSWSDPPYSLRSGARRDAPVDTRNDNKGFRVVRELD